MKNVLKFKNKKSLNFQETDKNSDRHKSNIFEFKLIIMMTKIISNFILDDFLRFFKYFKIKITKIINFPMQFLYAEFSNMMTSMI